MASEYEREKVVDRTFLKYSQPALLIYIGIVLPLFYFESVYGFESRAFLTIMATLTIGFIVSLGIINLYIRKKFCSSK
jgi:hypothetical protein